MKRPGESKSAAERGASSIDFGRKQKTNFFKDIFGKKGPDPDLVNEWLPPFLETQEDIEIILAMKLDRDFDLEKFKMGNFDELGFFHSRLDQIPDSEAKKLKETQIRAIEKDKDFARKIIRSVNAQLKNQRRSMSMKRNSLAKV
mmetsp:Transcript_27699/g.38521  ORF Transcript_27699/g.38521 Transcript_27699/m.38521 type:complete len:144 (+) Transcript_27699:35-466(+)